MSLQEEYQALIKEPITEAALFPLTELRLQAKAEQDGSLFAQISLTIAKYHESILDFDEAIALLKVTLQEEIINDPALSLGLVDQMVQILLKTEDFPALLEILKYREQFLGAKKSQLTMQKFYLSVCYEGMKETTLAIQTLLEVEDTLSNNNLVSKYLKLSMLYLKANNLAQAKAMFEYAKIFDRAEKNPIFQLALSDIDFNQGLYIDALNHYQNYFLHSLGKSRYLDRFILISLRLKHYDEAWKFYEEYLPQVEKQISKHTRLLFYEAAILLTIELKNMAEVSILQAKIRALSQTATGSMDSFDDVYRLIDQSLSEIKPQKARDIVLHLFRKLDPLTHFQRLVMVHVVADGFAIWTYRKGLILEKTLSFSHIQGTLVDKVMSTHEDYLLFTETDLAAIPDYQEDSDLSQATIAICHRINQHVYPTCFLIALQDNESNFHHAGKLLWIAKTLLENKLESFLLESETDERRMLFEQGLAKLDSGFVKIENGIVYLLTAYTKTMMQCAMDSILFEEFQQRIIGQKQLFLDDFLHQKQLVFSLQLPSGDPIRLIWNGWHHQLAIYAVVTVDHSVESLVKQTYDEEPLYHLRPLSLLEADLRTLTESHTYLLLTIPNALSWLSSVRSEAIGAFGKTITVWSEAIAKQYYYQAYTIDLSHFLIILKTTDKRTLERISRELNCRLLANPSWTNPIQFQFSAYLSSRKLAFPDIIQKLTDILTKTPTSTHLVRYPDKQLTQSKSLHFAIVEAMKPILSEKQLDLEYHPYRNWKDQKAMLVEAMLSEKISLGERADFTQAFIQNNLWLSYLTVFQKQLCKDLKRLSANSSQLLPVVFDIGPITLSTELAESLVKEFQKARIHPEQVVFAIHLPQDNFSEFIQIAESLQNAGYSLMLKAWIEKLPFAAFNQLAIFDYGLIQTKEVQNLSESLIEKITSLFRKGLIYDHCDQTLRKSFLLETKIQLVKGKMYPPYPSLEAWMEENTSISRSQRRNENAE